MLYYSGHIFAVHMQSANIEVYRVNGPLSQAINLQDVVHNYLLQEIDYLMIPKLDWQDREFDTQMRAEQQLPRKLVAAGTYQLKHNQAPFLMIHDRQQPERSIVRLFKSRGKISCLQYGPYDNGHILMGLTTGDFFAFDSINLQKMCNIKISDCPVTQICIEWTQLVLIGV